METVAVIIPTYGHFDYAADAVHSLFKNTKIKPYAIIVDDASPDFYTNFTCINPKLKELTLSYGNQVHIISFSQNGGLTRSWNEGLRIARDLSTDLAVCTNSDVLFSPGWDTAIIAALNHGYTLVGPVTNTPGTEPHQYVGKFSSCYLSKYKADPSEKALTEVAKELTTIKPQFFSATLNGFCLAALTKNWFAYSYDKDVPFRPRNDYDSRGRPNPTPLMTLQEYELQRRWHALGLLTGVAMSYVFHYRSISRGKKYLKGDFAKRNNQQSK